MNIYAYIAIIVLLLGIGYWLDSNGYDRAIANQAIAEKEQLKEDSKTIDKLREKGKKRGETIAILKSKLRKTAQANKGCYKLTDPLPADFVNGLRDAYSAIQRSPAK